VVIDGCIMLTARIIIYHEMMSHPAPTPTPTRARWSSSAGTAAPCASAQDAGVRHALQVEIDERVTRLSEQYFELCVSSDDPRAGFFFGDGIRWMQGASRGRWM
jgi:spermidine synthase